MEETVSRIFSGERCEI